MLQAWHHDRAAAIVAVLLAASACISAVRSITDLRTVERRFAGRPLTAGLDDAARRFIPTARGFSARVRAVSPQRGDRYLLDYDEQHAVGGIRPWVLSLFLGKALLPAIRTLDPDAATIAVSLQPALPSARRDGCACTVTFSIRRIRR